MSIMLEDWAGIWREGPRCRFPLSLLGDLKHPFHQLLECCTTFATAFVSHLDSPAVFRLLKGHLSLKAGQFPVMSLSLSVRPPYGQTPLPNTGHFSAISSSFKKCGYCRIKRSYGHTFIGHALIDSQLQHRQPKLQLWDDHLMAREWAA